MIPPSLDTPEFRAKWDEWWKERAARKHPITPATRSRQLALLARHPVATAIQMIEQSLNQGWQGLFEVRNADGRRTAGDSRQTPRPSEGASSEAHETIDL